MSAAPSRATVPGPVFGELVRDWLAGFTAPQAAFEQLAAGGTVKADTWRKRLSPGDPRWSWVSAAELDVRAVDEFLTAADEVERWQLPPLAAPKPALPRCRFRGCSAPAELAYAYSDLDDREIRATPLCHEHAAIIHRAHPVHPGRRVYFAEEIDWRHAASNRR